MDTAVGFAVFVLTKRKISDFAKTVNTGIAMVLTIRRGVVIIWLMLTGKERTTTMDVRYGKPQRNHATKKLRQVLRR